MAILNKTQVDELFSREAVLLGQADCVPGFRAANLFSKDAVCHAKKIDGGWNAYGIGDFTLYYLTRKGFQAAASFYNVQQLQEEAELEEASYKGIAESANPS